MKVLGLPSATSNTKSSEAFLNCFFRSRNASSMKANFCCSYCVVVARWWVKREENKQLIWVAGINGL